MQKQESLVNARSNRNASFDEVSATTPPKRIEAAKGALAAIDDAWTFAMGDCLAVNSPQLILDRFNNKLREILDATEITRNWSESDLPSPGSDNPLAERRGPMDEIQPWREAYFRLTVACLLADMEMRWTTPAGESFWKTTFPAAWRSIADAEKSTFTPPLSPSLRQPRGNTTARSVSYQETAHQVVLTRIQALFPNTPLDATGYAPDDKAFFPMYCFLLSGLSTYLSALQLNLCEKGVGLHDVIECLFDETIDPFKRLTRHRAENQLWPTRYKPRKGEPPDVEKAKRSSRRVYADLCLRPLLRQVLNYVPSGWQATTLTLPMMDANCRAIGTEFVFNGLRRSDIELAVWCESMMMILDSLPVPAGGNFAFPRKYGMNLIPGLPKYRHCLAEDLKRVCLAKREERLKREGDMSIGSSRFAQIDSYSSQQIRTLLKLPELQVNESVTLLPAWLTTPVLEKSDFRLNIEWDWLGSNPDDAEWLEFYLLVLTGPESSITVLEYEEVESEESDADDPLFLRLGGEAWQKICAQHPASFLATAFGEALFCRMDAGLGTGVIVIGMIDLSFA